MTRLFSILDGIGDNSACGLLQVHLEKVMFATTVFFGDGLQDGPIVCVCVCAVKFLGAAVSFNIDLLGCISVYISMWNLVLDL